MWTPEKLRAFEEEIRDIYLTGAIRGPIHLSGNNEEQLIEIFKQVRPQDWVLSTHRSHYHALLKGVPPERVKAEILAGRSIHLNFSDFRFYTSAIVGGICPWAVGIAMGIEMRGEDSRVWCFVGDMGAQMGIFHECQKYARLQLLPLTWVIEDNSLSTNSPTYIVWGYPNGSRPRLWNTDTIHYTYQRRWPHIGIGAWVDFGEKKTEERTDVMG
jgi:pyruvate dehydrogenase E1 component alpha subunit